MVEIGLYDKVCLLLFWAAWLDIESLSKCEQNASIFVDLCSACDEGDFMYRRYLSIA
jgi:hypothetical protein